MLYLADTWFGRHILSMLIFFPVLAAAVVYTRTRWDGAAIRRFAFGALLVTLGCRRLSISCTRLLVVGRTLAATF